LPCPKAKGTKGKKAAFLKPPFFAPRANKKAFFAAGASHPVRRLPAFSTKEHPMKLVLISGLSGSGKSVALRLLEDHGFYCVDNLPAPMLLDLYRRLQAEGKNAVAVAVDARSGESVAALPDTLQELQGAGVDVSFLFLEAQDDVLIARFSETRRSHPLAGNERTLVEAIACERGVLRPIAALGQRIDTTGLAPASLRQWIWQMVGGNAGSGLTLLFESFGFKHGLPQDADLVFDARCLPNPHYEPALRPLSGKDAPVADFLERQPKVIKMKADIEAFIRNWLPAYQAETRSYLTVAIGCTGGQHRSVFLAESLAKAFAPSVPCVLVRHRALEGKKGCA
jgi:UPF0042 nucleotide-binding protein